MDESHIIDQLRAGADSIGTDDSDVDALVEGALVQGRQRRTRRRVGAVLGTVVAAAVVVTVVATGVVPTRLGTTEPAPVGTPVIATPAPTTSRLEPTPSPEPSPPTTGHLSGTPAQVQQTLVRLMPASTTVTRAVSDSGKVKEGREHNAYLDLRDAKGTSNLAAGVGDGRYSDMCSANTQCLSVRVGGGTLWLTTSPPGDKAGQDQSAFYNRPDGGHLWLTQSNFVDGNGPVTRKGLPLSTDQVRALMTNPTWDRFFHG